MTDEPVTDREPFPVGEEETSDEAEAAEQVLSLIHISEPTRP